MKNPYVVTFVDLSLQDGMAYDNDKKSFTNYYQNCNSMMKSIIKITTMIFIMVVSCNVAHAQAPNNWIMFGFPNNNVLEFSPNFGVSYLSNIYNQVKYSNAAIADSAGNLLYYTNGYTIWNSQHQRIMNDDTLCPSYYTSATYNSGLNFWQMDVFIPDPGDTNEIYLFYAGGDIIYFYPQSGGSYVSNKFYYAKINKTINGLNGFATSINNIISNDTIGLSVCAIKHGNGRDWWIVVRHNHKPEFIRFLVDPSGVHGPFYQTVGPLVYDGFVNFKFAPGTNKIACSNAWHLEDEQWCDIYDFDRCTGLASNPITLHFYDNSFGQYQVNGGCEFSPSGRYLYVSTTMKLRQFDMLAPNIAASGIVLDSVIPWIVFDGLNSRMQLGPDNKLYIDKYHGSSQWINVVNQPDSPGFACNYVDSAITFTYPVSSTMPNIPHYEIGAMVGSACDTLSAGLTPTLSKGEGVVYAIYNAFTQQLVVTAKNIKGKNVTITVYDGRGSAIKNYELKIINGYATVDVDCSGWSDGLYILHLQTEKEMLNKKFVKE